MSTRTARGARAFTLSKVGTVHTSATDLENAASSALAGAPEGTTFVTINGENGLQHVIVTDDRPGIESVPFAVARGIAARSEEIDEVPDLVSAGGFARLVTLRDATPMMDTQAGADPTALSRIIGDLLKPGEWVAVSIRTAHRSELKRQSRWLDHHGLRTHHSRKTGAPVMALYAGGSDTDRATSLVTRVASAIPGFGLPIRSKPVTPLRSAAYWAVSALLAAAVAVASSFVPFDVFGISMGTVATVAGITAVLLLVCGVLAMRGIIPTEHSRLVRGLAWGRVPTASARTRPPRKPHREKSRPDKDGQVRTIPEFAGDYPLAPDAFLVGAHIPIEVVAPHSQSSSGASTGHRSAPSLVREKIGPQLGVNLDEPVHLSVADAFAGLIAMGASGSGKTALLEHLWGSALSDRLNQAGIPGAPKRHAMIAFDTKGDGLATEQYAAWAQHVGDQRTVVVHVLDPVEPSRTRTVAGQDGTDRQVPATMGVDMFPYNPDRDDATGWARRVTNGLRYIWGETSIGPESFDTLTRVLAAARLVTPDMAARVSQRTIPRHASPFFYANILLTNEGDDLAVELAAAINEAAANPTSTTPGLVDVVSQLSPLYGAGRSPAQRAQLVKAPRTKVAALMGAEHWWAHPNRHSWEDLLQRDAAVVLNTGVGPSGHLPDDKLRTDMSGLMLYTLAEEVKRVCIGWFEQQRAVTIYADEVKHLANASAEVINWMRNDARANGVRCVFATQTPETLVSDVRGTLLGFGALIAFAQGDDSAATDIVRNFRMSGGEWELSDVSNLDKYMAIARLTVDGKRQEPFTITLPNYRAQREDGSWTA